MSEPIVVVDRYEMIEELASGGMATVYLGRVRGAVGFARAIAMKRLHRHFAKDREFVAMFIDEARLASRIRHPNVVPTLDIVSADGELFLVMEYIHGESLSSVRRVLESSGVSMPVPIAVAIVVDVLNGLHAAHEATGENGQPLEVVHRDVSPQNVLIGVDGVSRVLDFGVSKAVGRLQSTTEGQVKGKASYMAPEQLTTGLVDRRCDVYAASVVLWELLARRRLFTGDSHQQIMTKVLSHDVPALRSVAPDVSPELEEIVMCGLDASPDRRFASAHEMGRALRRAAPPAAAFDVGEWLKTTMRASLEERSALLARVEQGAQRPTPRDVARAVDLGPVTELTATSPTVQVAPSRRGWLLPAIGVLALLGGTTTFFALRDRPGAREAIAPPPSASIPPQAASTAPAMSASVAAPETSASARHVPASGATAIGTAAKARNKCNPPYTVDADGRRHFLVECL